MNPNLTIYKEYPYFLDGQFESENIQEKLIENHLAQPLEDAGLYIDEECGFRMLNPRMGHSFFWQKHGTAGSSLLRARIQHYIFLEKI